MTTKKAVNLSIDAALVAEAKFFGTNMSALLEQSLRTAHFDKRQAQWRADSAEAVANWNDYVDEHGLLADTYKV
jgi:antitoxin CcdA